MDALGVSNSRLYELIGKGIVPQGIKIDPNGRVVVWWADEIEKIQKAAVERQATEAVA